MNPRLVLPRDLGGCGLLPPLRASSAGSLHWNSPTSGVEVRVLNSRAPGCDAIIQLASLVLDVAGRADVPQQLHRPGVLPEPSLNAVLAPQDQHPVAVAVPVLTPMLRGAWDVVGHLHGKTLP